MKSSDNVSPADTAPAVPAMPSEIFTFSVPFNEAVDAVADSADIFEEDDGSGVSPVPVPGRPGMLYVPFGHDDDLPYRLIRTIGRDEVLSQNLFFNILTLYGSGLKYIDPATKRPSADPEIERFMLTNSMPEFFLEQCTDIKYYFFAVAVVILNKAGNKIVRVRHKDASFCRFEKAGKNGRVNNVFYANWKKRGTLTRDDIEVIPLLDEKNPLGDLEERMGLAPGRDGRCRRRDNRSKFAIVMRFPTPGQRYYPTPYYSAIFRGDWYDLKRLIGSAKKAKIRNHAQVKYQVEIHRDFWASIMAEENISDPLEQLERMKLEKQRIKDFVTGSRNSGKVWISGYYTDSYGKEQRMVRINVIDTSKEGGDWSEDIQETSNMLCYGTNIHPNLVGATPGKSQTNNSGSDKRELFTLKQSLETAFHDTLLKFHNTVIFFNRWEGKCRPQVPIVLLTTLDQNTDAKRVNPDDGSVSDPND